MSILLHRSEGSRRVGGMTEGMAIFYGISTLQPLEYSTFDPGKACYADISDLSVTDGYLTTKCDTNICVLSQTNTSLSY